MTTPLSIFIRSAASLDTLARALEGVVGQQSERLALDVGTVFRCRAFDIEFLLFGDHGLSDDSGIRFTRYQYQIDLIRLEVSAPVAGFDEMYGSLATYLAGRLSLALECRAIVVLNLQRMFAVFESGIAQSVDENAEEPGAVS